MPALTPTKARSRWRQSSLLGLAISFATHALVLVLLLLATRPQLVGNAVTVSARFGQPETSSQADAVRVVTTTEEITGALVESRIQTLIARQDGLQPEQQLDRLDQASAHLERVSSSESVDEMADQFQEWLGLAPRAVQPAARPVEGEFDFDTAQLHDVTRCVDETGTVTYLLVLLDAQGRTTTFELNEEEGRTIYELMQRLKANPLLEKLYRRIAIPLLDRLIRGKTQDDDER